MPIPNINAILTAGVLIGQNQKDTAVGLAWLKEHYQEWDRVVFNATIGPGATVPAGSPDYVQKWIASSTPQRADLIVYRNNDQTAGIVEIKQRIDGGALGQLLTYRYLLKLDTPALLQVYMFAIGVSIQAGITEFFRSQGVTVELLTVVPPVSG
jgi:hypothetical protein